LIVDELLYFVLIDFVVVIEVEGLAIPNPK
jgi:hypothetical protein